MKIAILGAGIGGLAAASLLRPFGEITVFDQFKQPTPVGSGLIIQPVGQEVLSEIGVLDHATRLGQPLYRMLGRRRRDQKPVLDVYYGPEGGDIFGLSIHRGTLFSLLLDAAKNNGVTIKFGHRFAALQEGADKTDIQFEKQGICGGFDLVIDAMGARSGLSNISARALPYGALWATIDWQGGFEEHILHQRYQKAHAMIGLMPLGSLPDEKTRRTALFWSLPRRQFATYQDQSISNWRKTANALWPEASTYINQIHSWDQFTLARYRHGTKRRPYAARLIHIGDAAHQASPQLGQGANMALLDALALARAMKSGSPDIGRAFWRSRRRHILIYQLLSALFTPLYQSDSRALPWLRDALLAGLSQWPLIRPGLQALVKGSLVPPIS